MIDLTQWPTLSPAEKDALIEQEIMHRPGPYSSDLQAAYAVANELISRGCYVSVWQGPEKPVTCAVWDADKPAKISKQSAATVPETICLAALGFVAK